MKKNSNPRSKYFTIELYEDSENISFNDKIEMIKKYDYAYILHDKDKKDDSSLKKAHYHVVVAFANYRYLNAISSEFDIPSNYIEPVNSLEGILTYLIHLNDKSKYQYSFDEVIGSTNLLNKMKKCIKNNNLVEEDKVLQIIDWVESQDFIPMSKFVKYVCSIGRYDVLRRSQFIFNTILKEHNEHVKFISDTECLSWVPEAKIKHIKKQD